MAFKQKPIKHVGFKAPAAEAGKGLEPGAGARIIGYAKAHASAAAKARNPRLKKTGGHKKGK